MTEKPAQRANIEDKYEMIYRALSHVADNILNAPRTDPAHTFTHLRDMLTGTWTTMFEVMRKSAARGSSKVPYAEFVAAAEKYNAMPCSWRERGVQRHGDRRAHDRAGVALVREMLVRHIPQDCDLVLDLGCGWGHRMFDVWLSGGPRHARYLGGDRSQHSANLIKQVATLFPEISVDWFYFNFLQPDFAPLGKDYRSVALFSVAAIEQVQHLGPGLFDQLFAQFPSARLTGIHIEPIGFQLEGAGGLSAEAAAIDRAYAEGRHYNLDLVHQARTHDKVKIIATETGILDQGVGNSTSVLVWTSR